MKLLPLLIISFVGVSAVMIYKSQNKNVVSPFSGMKKVIINKINSGGDSQASKQQLISLVNTQMTDDEIMTFYQVITKQYAQNAPASFIDKINVMSKKYNIFT